MQSFFIKYFLVFCLFCYCNLSVGMKRPRDIATCPVITTDVLENEQQKNYVPIKTILTYLEKKSEKPFLPQQTNPVTLCLLSPYNEYLITGINNNSLDLWNSKSKEKIESISINPLLSPTNALDLLSVSFSPDGTYLSAKTDKNFILQYNTQNKSTKVITLAGYNKIKNIISTSFSPSGKYIYAETDKNFILWNTSDGKILKKICKFLDDTKDTITCFTLTPDDQHILIATMKKKIILYDFATNHLQQYTSISKDPNDHICRLAFHPIENKLAIGTNSGFFMLASILNQSQNFSFNNTVQNDIDTIQFSPNAQYIAVFIRLLGLFIWNTQTGKEIKYINYKKTTPRNISFSHDSTQIIIGLNNGQTICISLTDMEALRDLKSNLSNNQKDLLNYLYTLYVINPPYASLLPKNIPSQGHPAFKEFNEKTQIFLLHYFKQT